MTTAFQIVNLLVFAGVFIGILMLLSKVASLPERKFSSRMTLIVFLSYIGLLMIAVPVAKFAGNDNHDLIEIDPDHDGLTEYTDGVRSYIENGDEDGLMAGYKTVKERITLSDEEVILWQADGGGDGYTEYDFYFEEDNSLGEDMEIIFIYPKVIFNSYDVTAHLPEVELLYDQSGNLAFSLQEEELEIQEMTPVFPVSQFSDTASLTGDWFISGRSSSMSVPIVWLRSGEKVDVEASPDAWVEIRMTEINVDNTP